MKNSLSYKIVTQVICVILLVILVFPLYLMVEKSLAVKGTLETIQKYLSNFTCFPILLQVLLW